MITAYDPNITWGTQRVRLTLMQWGYRATLEAEVGGNCQGFEIFESAISSAFDTLPTRNYDAIEYAMAHVILTAENGDTLECEDEDLKFEDWLKPMVVGIEIVRQEAEVAARQDSAAADKGES